MAIYRPPTLLQCLTLLILNTGYCMYYYTKLVTVTVDTDTDTDGFK